MVLLALRLVGSYPAAGLLGCAWAAVGFGIASARSLFPWTPLAAVGQAAALAVCTWAPRALREARQEREDAEDIATGPYRPVAGTAPSRRRVCA